MEKSKALLKVKLKDSRATLKLNNGVVVTGEKEYFAVDDALTNRAIKDNLLVLIEKIEAKPIEVTTAQSSTKRSK